MSRYPRGRRLMLVTDPEMTRTRGLAETVRAAVAGGTDIVQLRDKNADDAALTEIAIALRNLLAPRGVPLIINDRPKVAMRSGAAGVHIGQDDGDAAAARAIVGDEAILGWSVTDLAELRDVPRQADYIGLGPVFATATKSDAAAPLGLAGLRAARSMTALPIFAIGGIDSTKAASVIEAGADAIAIVSAICAARNPEAAARDLVDVIGAVAR
jgi:thiamine-phosphate pyrophosphorylase